LEGVHGIPENVTVLYDDIAHVNSNTKLDALVRWDLGIPRRVRELTTLADKILTEITAQCIRRKRSDGSAFPARTARPSGSLS
jgi:hypothetical protein